MLERLADRTRRVLAFAKEEARLLGHNRRQTAGPLPAGRKPASVGRSDDASDAVFCSFCGKSQQQVARLIAGPGVHICDECVALCADVIAEKATMSQVGNHLVARAPSDVIRSRRRPRNRS